MKLSFVLAILVVCCMTILAYASITAGQWIMAWAYTILGMFMATIFFYFQR